MIVVIVGSLPPNISFSRIVHPAHPSMNSKLSYIRVSSPSMYFARTSCAIGFIMRSSSRLLASAMTSNSSCCILRTYADVSPFLAITPRIFIMPGPCGSRDLTSFPYLICYVLCRSKTIYLGN